MDQEPFSPSPLAVLCQGHESGAGMRSSAASSATCPWLQVTFRGHFLHLSPESCLSHPQVWPNQCLGNQGTVSCVALMRGRDEHGQALAMWLFKKNTSSVRLSITFAHNRSANKMQVLTSSTSCSIRRVLSRDWKETGQKHGDLANYAF